MSSNTENQKLGLNEKVSLPSNINKLQGNGFSILGEKIRTAVFAKIMLLLSACGPHDSTEVSRDGFFVDRTPDMVAREIPDSEQKDYGIDPTPEGPELTFTAYGFRFSGNYSVIKFLVDVNGDLQKYTESAGDEPFAKIVVYERPVDLKLPTKVDFNELKVLESVEIPRGKVGVNMLEHKFSTSYPEALVYVEVLGERADVLDTYQLSAF